MTSLDGADIRCYLDRSFVDWLATQLSGDPDTYATRFARLWQQVSPALRGVTLEDHAEALHAAWLECCRVSAEGPPVGYLWPDINADFRAAWRTWRLSLSETSC